MNTVYNPLTGQWERVDDVVRPFPVIARDTRLLAANDTTPFTPSLAAANSPGHTDIFGNTGGFRATIGIAVGNTSADIVIPDPWRIRRFVVVCSRTGSGSTNVAITCTAFGRLLAPDGSPAVWRGIASVSDSAFANFTSIRFALPASLAGVFGYDQYRIVFRRDTDSDPAPQLSLVRIYAEF